MINEMIGHFEEKNKNKYSILDDADENKEVSKNMKKFEKVLKKIETINGGEKIEYRNHF